MSQRALYHEFLKFAGAAAVARRVRPREHRRQPEAETFEPDALIIKQGDAGALHVLRRDRRSPLHEERGPPLLYPHTSVLLIRSTV